MATKAAPKKGATKVNLKSELKNRFGFASFKDEQQQIIQSILGGKDTFVIMPTGGGKSLCYQLPALVSEGVALVISPLIALMKNQVDLVRSYSSDDSIAHFMNSSLNKGQLKEVKEDLVKGGTKLLYVAPETLTKAANVEFFKTLPISFIAVDEAHCISEWGHDFRPEYRKIRQIVEEIDPTLNIIALTATATPKVQDDIQKNLELKKPNIFISSFNRTNLHYSIVPKKGQEKTIRHMVKFIKGMKGKSGIIYTLNRKSTEDLATLLEANGVKAVAYHAGLDAKTRAKRQDLFLMGDVDVIVATIAFGMGIDKPDIRFVIHYNLPKSIENYYQETGRAGRDGLEGKCVLYFSNKDLQKLEHLMRQKPLSEREMGTQLIDEMVAYSESSNCRRKVLLHYFGEEYDESACDEKCDNCQNPKEKIDVKDTVFCVLTAIKQLKEKFAVGYVVDIVLGRGNSQIQSYKHDALKCFGNGAEFEMDDHFWFSLVRQMMIEGLIKKDIEEYGLLKLTKTGKEFLKKPYTLKLALNHQFIDTDDEGGEDYAEAKTEPSALDPQLLQDLMDLRKKVASEKGVQPWVVFDENSLNEMATMYPTSVEELGKISGVSEGKARKYGRKFIAHIDDYVEANNIVKPEDFVMKSVVNKSGKKVYIIQSIDKKIPLEDIASGKSMKMDELFQEMETIVQSGTKLDIDYTLEDFVDDYDVEDIFEYFNESDSGDIEEAVDALEENDISFEQIQLVRIKYLSEVAN
jgi:ATP-dependent DNA helicase RecQ